MLKKIIVIIATFLSFNQIEALTKQEKNIQKLHIKIDSCIKSIDSKQQSALKKVADDKKEILVKEVVTDLFDIEYNKRSLTFLQKDINKLFYINKKEEKKAKDICTTNELAKKKEQTYQLQKKYDSLLSNNKKLMIFFEHSERFKYAYNIFKEKQKLYSSIKSLFLNITFFAFSFLMIPLTFAFFFSFIPTLPVIATGNITFDLIFFVIPFALALSIIGALIAIAIVPAIILTIIAFFSITFSLIKVTYFFVKTRWEQGNMIPACVNKDHEYYIIADSSLEKLQII